MSLKDEIHRLNDLLEFYLTEAYGYPESSKERIKREGEEKPKDKESDWLSTEQIDLINKRYLMGLNIFDGNR